MFWVLFWYFKYINTLIHSKELDVSRKKGSSGCDDSSLCTTHYSQLRQYLEESVSGMTKEGKMEEGKPFSFL